MRNLLMCHFGISKADAATVGRREAKCLHKIPISKCLGSRVQLPLLFVIAYRILNPTLIAVK